MLILVSKTIFELANITNKNRLFYIFLIKWRKLIVQLNPFSTLEIKKFQVVNNIDSFEQNYATWIFGNETINKYFTISVSLEDKVSKSLAILSNKYSIL